MFDGKLKALTFSFDDGVEQDRWLVELFNKYGLKGTFNLNSGRFGQRGSIMCHNCVVPHCMLTATEASELYVGHEIAGHSVTHPTLTELTDNQIVYQTECDIRALEAIAGYRVVGFAYPNGGWDPHVMDVIANKTNVMYARTVHATHAFSLPTEPLAFHPTVYHLDWDALTSLADCFISARPREPMLFTIWGHSYEFDCREEWKDRFEKFCKQISGLPDVAYITNRQAIESIPAFRYNNHF